MKNFVLNGISCGRIALERADIKVDKYYASEIKKIAIFQLCEALFPTNSFTMPGRAVRR